MKILFEKNFTNDNKLSASYVVDRLQEILHLDEFQKQELAIHEFKNELIHDMGLIVMCKELKLKEKA